MNWTAETLRVTALSVAAGVVLVVAGAAGLGGSVPLLAALVALALGLYAGRDRLAALPRTVGHDLGAYGRDGWVAPLLAAAAVAVAGETSPAELQAVGGLLGLAGMINYFLRPVYHGLVAVGRYAGRLAG